MAAKKKRVRMTPTVTLRKKTLDALMLLAEGDVEPYVQKAEGWRKRMVEAEALLKKGEATIYENAKVVGQLNQELFSLRKEIAAERTSVEFWTYEASRWRKEAEDLRREEAMARVDRGEPR